MKKVIAEHIQKVLTHMAVNSVGKSIPFGIYERKISPELSEEIAKIKKKD